MSLTLKDKVVAVTGATSGSGLAIAQRFIDEGAEVVLLARGQQRLAEVTASLGDRATGIVCDVGDVESVRQAFAAIADTFGKIDVLINNAAVYRPCAVESLTDLDIAQQVATNLVGPIYTCRAAIPLLRAAGGGDIVNTSSESTLSRFPHLSIYVATKAALEAFTSVLAQELIDDDIRVTNFVQGTMSSVNEGSTDWTWDPQHGAAAFELWEKRGLLAQVYGRYGGQDAEAIADVHVYIVTRPRSQKIDTIYCRSF